MLSALLTERYKRESENILLYSYLLHAVLNLKTGYPNIANYKATIWTGGK